MNGERVDAAMSRRWLHSIGAAGMTILMATSAAGQQAQSETIQLCYVGGSGTVYVVAQTGTPANCTKSTHTQKAVNQIGPKGDKGDKGDAGPAGEKGPQGEPGPAGAAGAKGDKGDPGAPGPKGDKGDPGAPGPKGDKGDPCPSSDAACRGPQGLQGAQGLQGLQGLQGIQGIPGPQGPAGTAFTGLAIHHAAATLSANGQYRATCPAGKSVVAFGWSGATSYTGVVHTNRPAIDQGQMDWVFAASAAGTWSFYWTCANAAPAVIG